MSSINEALAKLKELRPPEEPKADIEEIEPQNLSPEEETPDEQIDQEDQGLEFAQAEPEAENQPEVEDRDTGADIIELEAEQLASVLGLEDNRLINDEEGIKFRAKIGNDVEDVSLEQLLNAYQGDKVLTNRSKEIAKLEQAQQQHLKDLADRTNQFAQQSAAVLEALQEAFVNPYSKEELKALREDDPAEYAARKQEISEREKAFSDLVNKAVRTAQDSHSMQSEEYQRQYADYFQKEQQKTLEMIPNWKKVEGSVAQYASDDLGFTPQEISQIADSRLLKAFYNSMMYEKGQKGAKTKLVRKVPKLMKGGKPATKNEVNLENRAKAREKLKQTGDWRDAVAALKS